MKSYDFFLLPFEGRNHTTGYDLSGVIERKNSGLHLTMDMTGEITPVAMAPREQQPQRKDRLWEQTCFECFISPEKGSAYWEFNLSPAGHWNVYRFDSYRTGMRREKAYGSLPIQTQSSAGSFQISCDIDLSVIRLHQEKIRMGVCAVVKMTSSEITYWALHHAGTKPDFHKSETFKLTI